MEDKKIFDKSPLNYIGNKYKLLPQIYTLFPKDINVFVDLFTGGGDVCSNVEAKYKYANDINNYVIGIYKKFQSKDIKYILEYIDKVIKKYELSTENREGYDNLRKKYNSAKRKNPLDLFILSCYSFNHQIRFNSNGEFNCPFGKDRSCFNDSIKQNLIKFHKNISNVKFSSLEFKSFDFSILKEGDFIYLDPPYNISTGSYNDGKRGFNGWSEKDDEALFKILDELNERKVKFALSNVTEHKGLKNEKLIKWKEKYTTHELNFNYNNSNYQSKSKENKTIEVLITNY